VRLSVTRQNPRDANTGLVLLRRAKNFASLGVVKQYGAWKVGGEWQYSGARTDVDINSGARTRLAPYDVANLTASYPFDPHFDLNARVDNLFNRTTCWRTATTRWVAPYLLVSAITEVPERAAVASLRLFC